MRCVLPPLVAPAIRTKTLPGVAAALDHGASVHVCTDGGAGD